MKISTSLKALVIAAFFAVGCDLPPESETESTADPAAAETETDGQALRPRPGNGTTETCMAECKRVRCVDGAIRNCDAYCTTYCYFKDILSVNSTATASATTTTAAAR